MHVYPVAEPPETLGGHQPPLLARRLRWGQLIALDALAAGVYTTVLLGLTVAHAEAVDVPSWAQCLIVVGVGAPVAVRRLWPLPVFGVVLACSVLSMTVGMTGHSFVAPAFALYLVALSRAAPHRRLTLVLGLVAAIGAALSGIGGMATAEAGGYYRAGEILYGVVLLGGAWVVGRAVRERRAYATRASEQHTGQAVSEERLRIARELHDIVAHSISLIAVKAGVANHVIRAQPEEAADALRVIEASSRDALTEMRHLLRVLRADGAAEPDILGPAPRLAKLPTLVEQAAMAGVRVRLDVRGAGHPPDAVQLTAYRIVQEAVTNVVKHAAPAGCDVTVEAREQVVRIEVTDDGPGTRTLPSPDDRAGGHGLIGMRERVAAYGGTFDAGPPAAGGFRVVASLPYEAVPGVTGARR